MTLEQAYIHLISLSFFRPLLAVFILMITALVARIVNHVLRKKELGNSKLIKVDRTHFSFLRHFIIAAIYVIGFVIAVSVIPSLEKLAVSLFAGAGVLAVIIGFASQKAFSNVVSGIFIAIFKPFRVGDLIEIQNITGYVEDITLRHTVIKDFENIRHIIPNTVVSDETIKNTNIVEDEVCKHVTVGISYGSDVDKALDILQTLAEKHPLCIDHRTKKEKEQKLPKVKVEVVKLDDSSVNLKAWVWTKNASDAYQVFWDLNKQVKKAYDKAGIEIPFPHRTVYLRK
ncbi:MAG: mechanosensitive ion channel family protein [Nanoarchaeota archaeon]|nr:mechanosensitive ion channel family protein [Nanoarchaeota archaeon]